MALTVSQTKERLADLLEIDKKEADNILWAFSELCTEVVEQGDSFTIPGVGKISCKVQPPRNARNPRTGEAVKVPAKVVVKFGLAKSLKDSAPTLKSKEGKALLAAAEEAQALREKRKRQRERDAAKGTTTTTKKKVVKPSKTKATKSVVKKTATKSKARY